MKNMYTFVKAAFVALVVMAAPGCKWFSGCTSCTTSSATQTGLKEISADELKAKMASTVGLMVINVLSADNYKDCHIAGSLSVPMADLEKACETWDKNQEIVTYCAKTDCPASKEAQQLLQSKGFTNVAHFPGGSKEWKHKGYPTEGDCKAEYLK